MSDISTKGRRDHLGYWGLRASIFILLCVALAFGVLQAAIHTWSVGKYISGHASVFFDGFAVSLLLSVVTLTLSLCGLGKARIIGSVVSIGTIIAIVAILLPIL